MMGVFIYKKLWPYLQCEFSTLHTGYRVEEGTAYNLHEYDSNKDDPKIDSVKSYLLRLWNVRCSTAEAHDEEKGQEERTISQWSGSVNQNAPKFLQMLII